MPSATNNDTVLSRIAALARDAMAQPDVPPSLQPILAEIATLSGSGGRDTPELSDLPQTDNQSL